MVLFRADSMRKVDSNTFVNSAWSKIHNVLIAEYVGKSDKRENLKTGVSKKKARQNFPKNEHFLPTDTNMPTQIN